MTATSILLHRRKAGSGKGVSVASQDRLPDGAAARKNTRITIRQICLMGSTYWHSSYEAAILPKQERSRLHEQFAPNRISVSALSLVEFRIDAVAAKCF